MNADEMRSNCLRRPALIEGAKNTQTFVGVNFQCLSLGRRCFKKMPNSVHCPRATFRGKACPAAVLAIFPSPPPILVAAL